VSGMSGEAGKESPGNFGHVTGVPATAGPFSKRLFCWKLFDRRQTMGTKSAMRKDNLKAEKLSLTILALCVVVLVYLLVLRPF
jgi:hypothetical protein